jgi:hypothetical protein
MTSADTLTARRADFLGCPLDLLTSAALLPLLLERGEGRGEESNNSP